MNWVITLRATCGRCDGQGKVQDPGSSRAADITCRGCKGAGTQDWFTENYPHSVDGAMREAWMGKDLHCLQRQHAGDVSHELREVLRALEARSQDYAHYQPIVNEGSLMGLISFLDMVVRAMEEHPQTVVLVRG